MAFENKCQRKIYCREKRGSLSTPGAILSSVDLLLFSLPLMEDTRNVESCRCQNYLKHSSTTIKRESTLGASPNVEK